MTYLLDISTLVARLIAGHQDHQKVTAWATGKSLALCPLTELGFLRVSMAAYGATAEQARATLADFWKDFQPEFVPADMSALDGQPFPSYRKSTDWYLANLAAKHAMHWATLDLEAGHPAAVVI